MRSLKLELVQEVSVRSSQCNHSQEGNIRFNLFLEKRVLHVNIRAACHILLSFI